MVACVEIWSEIWYVVGRGWGCGDSVLGRKGWEDKLRGGGSVGAVVSGDTLPPQKNVWDKIKKNYKFKTYKK